VQECILVIPRTKLVSATVGFLSVEDTRARQIVRTIREDALFLPRSLAEANFSYVQPIALVYIEHDDAILVLRRDDRDHSDALRGRDVLWVGGHIEPVDRGDPGDLDELDDVGDTGAREGDVISQGLRREIGEELPNLPRDIEPELVGVVTDDTSERSRMHLGLVHRLRIEEAQVAREIVDERHASGDGVVRPAFVPVAQLRAQPGLLEPWSLSILTDHLGGASTAASSGAGLRALASLCWLPFRKTRA